MPTSLTGWMTNPAAVHPSASPGPIGFAPPNNAPMLKRPRTPPPTNNPAVDYQTADSEHAFKRTRAFGISDENHGQTSYSSDDLPKAVAMTLNQGSMIKTMDFHPVHQILLLVGTNTGEIVIWDLGSREKLSQKNFKVWDIGVCSMPLQASLTNDYTVSIKRVTWSPDGNIFGVSYSKHICFRINFVLLDSRRQGFLGFKEFITAIRKASKK